MLTCVGGRPVRQIQPGTKSMSEQVPSMTHRVLYFPHCHWLFSIGRLIVALCQSSDPANSYCLTKKQKRCKKKNNCCVHRASEFVLFLFVFFQKFIFNDSKHFVLYFSYTSSTAACSECAGVSCGPWELLQAVDARGRAVFFYIYIYSIYIDIIDCRKLHCDFSEMHDTACEIITQGNGHRSTTALTWRETVL